MTIFQLLLVCLAWGTHSATGLTLKSTKRIQAEAEILQTVSLGVHPPSLVALTWTSLSGTTQFTLAEANALRSKYVGYFEALDLCVSEFIALKNFKDPSDTRSAFCNNFDGESSKASLELETDPVNKACSKVAGWTFASIYMAAGRELLTKHNFALSPMSTTWDAIDSSLIGYQENLPDGDVKRIRIESFWNAVKASDAFKAFGVAFESLTPKPIFVPETSLTNLWLTRSQLITEATDEYKNICKAPKCAEGVNMPCCDTAGAACSGRVGFSVQDPSKKACNGVCDKKECCAQSV
jgi:hypothetical protein